jgi:hypothetical protein|tara:strand:+ start:133 stop:1284 length:1152 start_codon:yes stop_codon:yes gene_type:complete
LKNLKIYFLILSIIGLIISLYILFEISENKNSITEFPDNFDLLLVENVKQNDMPDIYYIVLDEYAGIQTLKNKFNFDNSEFYNYLSEKGFFISSKSYSSYPYTILSIPSSLNMQYLDFNNNEITESAEIKSQIRYITDNNLVMKNLSENKYYIVSFFAGSEAIGHNNLIDEKICGENYFSSHDVAKIFPEERLKEKRNEILCTFEKMVEIKNRINQPIFVYTHFSLPHDPFVLNHNGELQIFEETNLNYEKSKEAYIQQLKFANKMSIKVIDEILSDTDRDSIIIIQSDHGERTKIDWTNPTEQMIKQGLNNINAIYFPNRHEGLAYDKISNVNSFRIIFNEYFNAEFKLLEDKYFWMESGKPEFKITDVTEIIENRNESDNE